MSQQTQLPPRAADVLGLLKEKAMSGEEVAKKLKISPGAARAAIYLLNQRGLVEHLGTPNLRWGEERGRWKAKGRG